jgi:hypothetical protein
MEPSLEPSTSGRDNRSSNGGRVNRSRRGLDELSLITQRLSSLISPRRDVNTRRGLTDDRSWETPLRGTNG